MKMKEESPREFYKQHSRISSPGRHVELFDELPSDVASLSRIVQGLTVHEYVAGAFYGFAIPEERKSESHVRHLEKVLDILLALDPQSLSVARKVDKRLVGVCHHPMLMLIAMLRERGVPARGRCGFGTYFNPGIYEDHWLCEYWDANQGRWILVDPQFDEMWRKRLRIEHDVLDVPRDRFLVAADAWSMCRSGIADPEQFGILRGNLRGLWFIAGNLVHDIAALNSVEMLPWDVWGAMPKPDETLREEQLEYFDQLADLIRAPDATFDEMLDLYQHDDRVRVPATVFNAILNRPEAVDSDDHHFATTHQTTEHA